MDASGRLTHLCAAPRQRSELIAVETARAVLSTKCQHQHLFNVPVRMLVSRSALSKRPFCTRDVERRGSSTRAAVERRTLLLASSMASSMSAVVGGTHIYERAVQAIRSVERLPQLVIFDLDYTLWPYYVYVLTSSPCCSDVSAVPAVGFLQLRRCSFFAVDVCLYQL